MTRKRFEKLLMGKGLQKNDVRCLIDTTMWLMRIGFLPDKSYAELYQQFVVERDLKFKKKGATGFERLS